MSTCSRVRRDLPLFIGGDLGGARATEIGGHLRDCPRCRREAAGLQQPLKRLRGVVAPAVADSLFESMHAAIVARVEREANRPMPGPMPFGGWRVWVASVAAAALFVVGWCWVDRPAAPAALQRAPIAVPVGHSEPTLVVPYAGERVPVPLRLLGDDANDDRGAAGMMWRWRLRSLVDGEWDAPAPIAPSAPCDGPDRPSPR